MRIITALCFLCFSASMLFAKTDYHRVMFYGDASTSAIVGWHQESGSFKKLHLDTKDHGQSTDAYGSKFDLTHQVEAKSMNNHFVKLEGLQPNTAYYFVIEDSEGTSERYWFKTASNDPNDRFSFIVGGDARGGRKVRTLANKMVAKLKPTAVIFGGDFTGADLDREWTEFFEDWNHTIAEDGRIFPLVVSRGNHEHTNEQMVDIFYVPNDKIYYNVNFGGKLINLMTLNSEIQKGLKQMGYVKKNLKKHQDFTWHLVQYHKPCRPHVSWKKEGFGQRKWIKKFQKYDNIKLVFESDSHTCKTTWPILAKKGKGSHQGFKRDDEKGIIYVGEGTWGAPLREPDDLKPWTRDAAAVNQFKWIFVDKDQIELRTILYENVDEVRANNNDEPFNIPTNIKIWSPENGGGQFVIKK